MTPAGAHCPTLFCVVCGTPFHVPPYRLGFSTCCSRACRQRRAGWINREQRIGTGEKTPYLKRFGKRIHRAVVEVELGRTLGPDEIVHHRNGEKRDNRPCNLQIVDAAEHARMHDRPEFNRRKSLAAS